MKVCLIYPPGNLPKFLALGTIPLGIYKVGTILKNNGIEVVLLDQYSFLQYFEKKVKITKEMFLQDTILKNALDNTDILGFSVDSYNYSSGKLMISAVREINPDIKIILGGVHPTLLDEYVIKTSGADVILRGEAEERIVQLVSCLHERRSFANIPGITYLVPDGTVVRNEDAPFCSSEVLASVSKIDYRMITQLDKVAGLPVETSRGCLFKCKFCSILYKGKRRLFPLAVVKQDLIDASKLKKEIAITDDCLTFEFDRAQEILSFINGLDSIAIHFESRASDLAKDNCQILNFISKEKVKYLQIGVECGYDDGLKKIRKGITTTQVEKSCQKISHLGMEKAALLSFIIGFPWESMVECLQTISFAEKMRKSYGVNTVVNYWIPTPSELWFEMKNNGNIDESMFDDISWCFSDDVFYRTHPRINPREKAKLEFLISDSMSARL